LEIRPAADRPDLQLEKAAELVRLKVDLIVTFYTPSALAAKQATRDIPIVMAGAGDPVATGIVVSLARPGGNVTGQSSGGAELAGKSVELIRELIPGVGPVGVLADESDPFAKAYVAQISQAARSVGMKMEPIITRPGQPLEPVFETLTGKRVDGLLIQGSIARKEMLDLAIKHRLPAMTSTRLGPSLGALASYGSDYLALARQSAVYVDKILKGAKPADLPVTFPTKFLLIINLKTAKALGITVPPALIARADEVIE
jgi:putative ABC transport system substrate-binding protein